MHRTVNLQKFTGLIKFGKALTRRGKVFLNFLHKIHENFDLYCIIFLLWNLLHKPCASVLVNIATVSHTMLWTTCKKNLHSAALSSTPTCGSFKKKQLLQDHLVPSKYMASNFPQFVPAIPASPFSTWFCSTKWCGLVIYM